MSSIASVKAAIMTNIARVKVVSPSRVTVKVGPSGPVGPMAVGAGTGDMQSPTYDPQSIAADAFDRANHTGEQAISTVTGLQSELDGFGDMESLIYDPQGRSTNAFDLSNQVGILDGGVFT